VRQFKLSNDPKFVDKLRDVVGLYVDPPAHAIVLSVDEKSQIQALDRTQPGLPLKKGRAGTMTHDYKRHGATTLFAALNVLDDKVIGRNSSVIAIRSSSAFSTPSRPADAFQRLQSSVAKSAWRAKHSDRHFIGGDDKALSRHQPAHGFDGDCHIPRSQGAPHGDRDIDAAIPQLPP
jgi:hypothetical protein